MNAAQAVQKAAHRVVLGWRYLTGWNSFQQWHGNAWLDFTAYLDRSVFLLALCAAVALSAWWQTLASSRDLAAAGWTFAGVFVATWYVWNLVWTVRRDRRRRLRRLRNKATGALRKPELFQPQRGRVMVGRRVGGFRRGVVWERWRAYPVKLYGTYPSALLDDGNPRDREKVEAVILADLEGLGEDKKTWRQYTFTWQPSSNQFTATRTEYIPAFVHASEETMNRETMILGYTADGITGFAPKAHTLVMGSTGAGKSGSLNGWIASAISSGRYECTYIIDMKGDGDYGSFDGREGVALVATRSKPGTIARAFDEIEAMIEPRFAARQAASESHGTIPRPQFGEVLVVMDEAQDLVPDYGDRITNFVKKYRSAGLRLVYVTQRADIGAAMPGAGARDQFQYRIALGPLSAKGAEMLFDSTDSPLYAEVQKLPQIPGRFLARIDGQRVMGQAPFLPPDDVAWAAELYPPLRQEQRRALVASGVLDGGPGATSPDEADFHALEREVASILYTDQHDDDDQSDQVEPVDQDTDGSASTPDQPPSRRIIEED